MSKIKITWLGLRNDREKTIFLEGFWKGVNATDSTMGQVIECETSWCIERNEFDGKHEPTEKDRVRHNFVR